MGRKRRNNVYKYFLIDKENKKSICLVCNRVFKSTHGTNLLHHISRAHEAEYSDVIHLNNKGEYAVESANSIKISKDINDYFDVDDDTRCLICCAVLKDEEDPKSHLEKHHAGVLAKLVKNEDNNDSDATSTNSHDDADAAEDQDLRSEIIYVPSIKRKTETKTENLPKKRRPSSAKDILYEIKTNDTEKPHSYQTNNQVESFLNYIRLILNEMPRDKCMKVQFDVLNVIIKSQVETSTSNVIIQNGNGANNEQATDNGQESIIHINYT